MFVVRTADGTPFALTAQVDASSENGVWTWMGFVEGGTAEDLTPGVILQDWLMWTDPPIRADWTCTKVNRVTAKFTNDQGEIVTVRVDR